MERDMASVRDLLESIAVGGKVEPSVANNHHLELMEDAGLVEHIDLPAGTPKASSLIRVRLTSQGREFLEAARDDSAWNHLKSASAHMGGMAFRTALEILLKQTQRK